MSEKIVLIDGHSILNRAFYGLPDLTNSEGLHTNAVYGFLNIMTRILEETWAQFKENARLVTGEWVNLPGEGGKTVHFDAYNLAVYKKKIPTFPKERIML